MWKGLFLSGSFVLWWFGFFISYVTGISVSYFITCMSPTMDAANAAVPTFGVLCLFFSGFLIRTESIGWWWRWYLYASPTYWALGAQLNNFFSGDRDVVFVGGLTVTEYYGLTYLPAWGFVGMQCIFPVVFLFCTWLALAYKTNVKR